MNNVLILTDFSENSKGAIYYGVSLFSDIPSRFTILNVPVLFSSEQQDDTVKYTSRLAAESALRELIDEINQRFPSNKITFKTALINDFKSQSVKNIVETENISIVILGTKSVVEIPQSTASNYYVELCETLKCTVLLVPESKSPSRPYKLVFAVDFKFNVSPNALEPLFYFARNLPSEVFLLQISSGKHSVQEAVTGLRVINSFEDIPFSFHMAHTLAIPQKIASFNKIHQSILLVLILHTFKSFEGAVNVNYVTQVIFQNKVPLLLIPN